MREIKFRAWDKDTDEMFSIAYPTRDEGVKLTNPDGTSFVRSDDREERVELMQYTGLKDKNGKEIYEGDVVDKKYHNLRVSDGVGEVQMGVGADSDGYCHEEWMGWKAGYSSLLDVHKECEVIGNIYDNPELLEQND